MVFPIRAYNMVLEFMKRLDSYLISLLPEIDIHVFLIAKFEKFLLIVKLSTKRNPLTTCLVVALAEH